MLKRAFDVLFRRLSPRVLGFLRALCGDPRLAEQTLASKTRWLRGLNIVLPGALLALFGLLVLLARRAQKRAFLESLNT